MNKRIRRCVLGCLSVLWASAGAVAQAAPAERPSVEPMQAEAGDQPTVVRATADKMWKILDRNPDAVLKMDAWVRPFKGQAAELDPAILRERLRTAPKEYTPRAKTEPTIVELPMPDGTFERFEFVDSPVMQEGLALKYPDIKSYLVRGVDDRLAVGRAVLSPEGFHATFYTAAEMVFISRVSRDDNRFYSSYWAPEFSDQPMMFRCTTPEGPARQFSTAFRPRGDRGAGGQGSRSGETLSTYRAAIAVTAEYTNKWTVGNATQKVTAVMALLNQMISAINVPYERDVCTRLILANNNDQLIQTDAVFDPFSDPATVGTTQGETAALLEQVIGLANYDIGHVLHYLPGNGTGNGNAGAIGSVCVDSIKGRGYSATDDSYMAVSPFGLVIVAHEFGHQFGGRHNFNNCDGGPREDILVCPEPGSGSTIMSYTGICGPTNLDQQSIPMFNQLNFDQMFGYLSTGPGAACAVLSPTGNTPPTVAGGSDFIIPSKTPYALTASASDADGDTLTYSWETKNVGPVLDIPITAPRDNGFSPINRVFAPSPSPTRSVPQVAKLMNPTPADIADLLPQVDRAMEWRVTVRDNHPGGGGVATADVNVQVIGFAGPFRTLSPNTGDTVSGIVTVTWDPAATNGAPINCTDVRISLSTDGGMTYPINLLNSTPNTGSALVVLPNLTTASARLKIEAVGNIFFNVTPGNFSITPPPAGVTFRSLTPPTISDVVGNGNSNGNADPGESSIRLTVPLINAGSTGATSVSATLTTTTPTATIVGGFSAYPAMPYGQIANNSLPFVFSLAPNHPCGTPVNFTLTVTSSQGSGGSPINFSIPTGSTGGAGAIVSFPYVGNPINIPDNNPAGITIPITVSGFGIISDVDFRFDGSACSALINDSGVGLTHSFVGDLIISLTSPQGTTVVLADRPGRTVAPTAGSSGNNFCQTNFNDDGNWPSIQAIPASGAPYTGAFKPSQPLSAFDGQNANGIWTLKIADVKAEDIGVFRAGTLRLTPNNPPGCAAPASTGACCVGSVCSITNTADCTLQAGQYRGNNSLCSPNPCQAAQGACCLGSTCSLVADAGACVGGSFRGAGVACNASGNVVTPCCKSNFNQLGGVTVQDVFDFLSAWFAGSPSADFNGGGISVQDVFDFLAAWFTGCP